MGREPGDPASGVRARRPLRRDARRRGRRGGLAAPPASRRRKRGLRGRGRRRPSPDRPRREVARAVPLVVSPRPCRSPLRRLPRARALGAGRVAHDGRLHVAHRPPSLRGRHRAHRADARKAGRGPRSGAATGERHRSGLPLGPLGDARPPRAADRHRQGRSGGTRRPADADRAVPGGAGASAPARPRGRCRASGASADRRAAAPGAVALAPRGRAPPRRARARRRQVGERQRRARRRAAGERRLAPDRR